MEEGGGRQHCGRGQEGAGDQVMGGSGLRHTLANYDAGGGRWYREGEGQVPKNQGIGQEERYSVGTHQFKYCLMFCAFSSIV